MVPDPFDGALSSVYQGGVAGPSATILEANNEFACVGGEQVLLIQDVVPWFAPPDQHPEGANVTELLAQGKHFCRIFSKEIETTDLAAFPEILISAAQTQEFYDNLFPGGTVSHAISDYVEHGGILSANLTDFAAGPGAFGNWAGDVFVGGVEHVFAPSQLNDIADPSHPVIADALPCPSGNCARIEDGDGIQDDLDGWNFDSHGFFTNLPHDTQIIIVDQLTKEPVTVAYRFGAGIVIATLTTTEWRYTGGFGTFRPNKKLLANEIAYQDCLVAHPHVIEHEPDPCGCRP